MSLAVLVALALLLVVPHLLPRTSMPPVCGIVLWMSVLTLRATITIVASILLVAYLPTTDSFGYLSQWCMHAVLPFLTTHVRLSGHAVVDFATLAPAGAILVTAISAGVGVRRASRSIQRWLATSSVGSGPANSIVVSGPGLIIAAAGIRQPRVVVSAGALINLDDGELAAGIQHEWGHVRRRHRFLSLTSVALLSCSRVLPGGRAAIRNLDFALERDADRFAVRETGDPLALASAICKVAGARAAEPSLAVASLGGADTLARLRILLDDSETLEPSHRPISLLTAGVAAAIAGAALSLLTLMPDLARAGVAHAHTPFGNLIGC